MCELVSIALGATAGFVAGAATFLWVIGFPHSSDKDIEN
jgi:hypothetical protein